MVVNRGLKWWFKGCRGESRGAAEESRSLAITPTSRERSLGTPGCVQDDKSQLRMPTPQKGPLVLERLAAFCFAFGGAFVLPGPHAGLLEDFCGVEGPVGFAEELSG